jgi:dihydroorotate dehydrogenase electron transfer subunit
VIFVIKGRITKSIGFEEYFLITIESEKDFQVEPGQFLMVQLPGKVSTPKPFSVMNKDGRFFTLLIKRVGDFTSKITERCFDNIVEFRGGYGTPYKDKIDKDLKYFLIGGGSGCAPLIFFNSKYEDMVLGEFYGFKNSSVEKLLNRKVYGEDQYLKNIIQIAKGEIDRANVKDYGIILCGSKKMIKSAKDTFKDSKIYVSLEERMGCGIGMCMGCPVKTKNGIKKVCKDGPIFDLKEVILEW